MISTEPEWDAENRGWALALGQNEDGLCGCGCGLPASVSQAPENEGMFAAEPPIRCFARTALDKFQQGYDEDPALLWETPKLRTGRGSG